MTEADWLACADPTPMLEFLRGKASDRKLRLFAFALVRPKWRFLTDAVSLQTVEVAERFAEGSSTQEELSTAARSVRDVYHRLPREPVQGRREALWRGVRQDARNAVLLVSTTNAEVFATHLVNVAAITGETSLLRDIFGNPFRPSPPLDPAVIAWNDGTVRRIAEGIYEERRLPEGTLDTARLGILADALLDAGCEDDELMQHCRSEGPHVQGCWAVDLILGKG